MIPLKVALGQSQTQAGMPCVIRGTCFVMSCVQFLQSFPSLGCGVAGSLFVWEFGDGEFGFFGIHFFHGGLERAEQPNGDARGAQETLDLHVAPEAALLENVLARRIQRCDDSRDEWGG